MRMRYLFRHLFSKSANAMNRYERRPMAAGEAEIEYLDGEFRILRPGSFVRCAATGAPIRIEELRYWNVDLQEPYSGPEAKLLRLKGKSGETRGL